MKDRYTLTIEGPMVSSEFKHLRWVEVCNKLVSPIATYVTRITIVRETDNDLDAISARAQEAYSRHEIG